MSVKRPNSVPRKSGHKGPGRQIASKKALATADRHAHWLQLRKDGKTYREIGEVEGVSHSTVQEAVVRRLRETVAEPANELRTLELMRLDEQRERLLKIVEKKANLFAENVLLKLSERRAKLTGLDAPTKLEVKPAREELWELVKGWLADPSPELVSALEDAGWTRRKELLLS
jgi:transposase